MTQTTAALIVAVLLLLIVGASGIAAIVRYPIDDALKMWAAIGTLFGTILGAIGGYYFSARAIDQAEKRADTAEQLVQRFAPK
jgi:hypothetical protein